MRFWAWLCSFFKKIYSSCTPPIVEEPKDPVTPVVDPPIVYDDYTPEKYHMHYRYLWGSMEIKSDKQSTVNWYVGRVNKGASIYKEVARMSGVPWQVIGCLHLLESGGNFDGILHNGEEIIGSGKKTSLVPKGRGPFKSWEEAAVDALAIKSQPKNWNVVNTLYYCERFNGLGYLRDNYKPNSPYIWSYSNHYTKGKYIRDGIYSGSAVSKQCGVALILKELNYN